MEDRDYHYYEANAADVNLEEITSSAQNADTLQRLRDGDPTLSHFSLRRHGGWGNFYFYVGEGDDMGWLGYFIGKSQCLRALSINYLPDGEEARAFLEGIARSQSIRHIGIIYLTNDEFTSTVRALHSLSQLEELDIIDNNSVGPDGWSELRTLLESGVCQLNQLRLDGNIYIGNAGRGILSNGLRGIGSSLKILVLTNIFIGSEGLLALVAGLTNCTGLEKLDLSCNEFSLAAAGLASLSDVLQSDEVNLKRLDLCDCHINDEGLQAFTQGAAIHCKRLDLRKNESITTTGLSYLSNSIRSDSCRVEALFLRGTRIGDDGMKVLARGLAGNKSVRSLYLDDLDDGISVTSAGWIAFSKALCDTSSVNSTYLSNHTICNFRLVGGDGEIISLPQDIYLYLQLNEQHQQHAAECKILMSHRHLDMTPFFSWDLKFLPMAVACFERAKPCTTLTIHDEDLDSTRRVLDESNDDFQNRALSAMYEFVRGMPEEVMKSREKLILVAHDDTIAMAEEEIKMLREDMEQRITQVEEENERLKEENKRLSEIVMCVANVAFAAFLFLAVVESMRSSSLDL